MPAHRRKKPLCTTALIASGLGRVWTQVWKRVAVALPCSCGLAEVSAVDHPHIRDTGLSSLFVETSYGCSYALSVLMIRKLFLSVLITPCRKFGQLWVHVCGEPIVSSMKPLPVFVGDYAPFRQLLFKFLLVQSVPQKNSSGLSALP